MMQPTADHPPREDEAIWSSAAPKPSISTSPTAPYQPVLSPRTPISPQATASPQAPTSPPLVFVLPIPEPPSPFPADLPPRPAPTHRGNFTSRHFTSAPAHTADIELGALPQTRNSQPSILAQQRARVSRTQRSFWLKIAVAVLFILGFWVVFMVWMGITARGGERGNGE
jgi:hypothetical protein